MAGTDKEDGRNPGAGSGEAVEDARLRVSEGVAGQDEHAGAGEGADERGKGVSGENHQGRDNGDSGEERDDEKQRRHMADQGLRGLDTDIDYMPFVHIGWSFRLVFVFVFLLGMACAIRAPWAWVFAVVGPAGYPALAAWSYYWFRKPGPRPGPPSDMMPVALTLTCVSLALLVSNNTVLAGLLSAVFGLAFCGVSTGEWLAVVAMRRRTGFRGAVRAAWLLERRARERTWRPLAGEG